jgi:hypothetical protein
MTLTEPTTVLGSSTTSWVISRRRNADLPHVDEEVPMLLAESLGRLPFVLSHDALDTAGKSDGRASLLR